jgi:hypothetical protein
MGWVCNGNFTNIDWSKTLATGDITDLAVRAIASDLPTV